jgi:hypothetical protein
MEPPTFHVGRQTGSGRRRPEAVHRADPTSNHDGVARPPRDVDRRLYYVLHNVILNQKILNISGGCHGVPRNVRGWLNHQLVGRRVKSKSGSRILVLK